MALCTSDNMLSLDFFFSCGSASTEVLASLSSNHALYNIYMYHIFIFFDMKFCIFFAPRILLKLDRSKAFDSFLVVLTESNVVLGPFGGG